MLSRNIEDKWFQIAALSASSDEAPRLYAKAITTGAQQTPGRVGFVRLGASAIGARQRPAEVQSVIEKVARAEQSGAEWWRSASLEGLALGMRGRTIQQASFGASQRLLLKIFGSPQGSVRCAALRLIDITGLPTGAATASAVERATVTAIDQKADADLRADAIGLIAIAALDTHQALLKQLIDPHQPDQVQVAAVHAYGKIKGDDVGKFLLTQWRALSPTGRTAAADAMYLEPSRVWLLVAALKNGDVQPWTLAFTHRRRLIMNNDPAIRAAARPRTRSLQVHLHQMPQIRRNGRPGRPGSGDRAESAQTGAARRYSDAQ